jgi:hypothetical protein
MNRPSPRPSRVRLPNLRFAPNLRGNTADRPHADQDGTQICSGAEGRLRKAALPEPDRSRSHRFIAREQVRKEQGALHGR